MRFVLSPKSVSSVLWASENNHKQNNKSSARTGSSSVFDENRTGRNATEPLSSSQFTSQTARFFHPSEHLSVAKDFPHKITTFIRAPTHCFRRKIKEMFFHPPVCRGILRHSAHDNLFWENFEDKS
jgi:hypothetical protein